MNEKILVVDDEQEIGELVGLYLKNEGYTVFSCTLGAEALALSLIHISEPTRPS